MKNVPKPPVAHVTIEPKVQKNIEGWIRYFISLSPRIKIVRTSDDNYKKVIDQVHKMIRNRLHLDKEDTIIFHEVAFILLIDSNKFGLKAIYEQNDIFLFCSNNVAFTVSHFARDPVTIEVPAHWNDESPYTKSLTSVSIDDYSRDLLLWTFIKTLVERQIRQIEGVIPDPPGEKG